MALWSHFLLLAACKTVLGAISCIGQDGTKVDWYIMYKLPRLDDAKSPTVRDGFGYTYMDSRNPKFELSKVAVTEKGSAPALTLGQVYDNAKNIQEDMAYIFYNDKAPEGREYYYYGHTKGDVAFDSNSGFWLIHSVPGMPPAADQSYEYPESGGEYGQHFLCVTFNASTFDTIGLQMRYNDPHIHSSYFPLSFQDRFPNVRALLQDDVIREKSYHSYKKISSKSGETFYSFGKTEKFNADLYHELVAPVLRTNLLAETWLHSRDALGPTCRGFTVEDIKGINLKTNSETFNFENGDDHSKFAIGKDIETPYVCIGDINRVESQFRRGGGTLCMRNAEVWKQYKSMVSDVDSC